MRLRLDFEEKRNKIKNPNPRNAQTTAKIPQM